MPNEMQIAYAAVLLIVLVAICIKAAASRSGISVRAWLVFLTIPLAAPNMNTESAMMRAIARDRAAGPARPPRRMFKRFDFHEEWQGPDQCFRISKKAGRKALRMLYLHGGAYILDLQRIQWTLAAGLLDRLGGEIVAPIYPLAPEHGWQESVAAIERVYLNLIGVAGAANVVVFGDSAGGGLALLLAQRLLDAGHPPPAALVLFSPWLDLGVSGQDQPALEAHDPALTIEFLRRAGKLWAKEVLPGDPRVSPLYAAQQGLPPTIVFSGSRDILDSDALRLAQVNPAIKHRHYRNMVHVWPCAPIPEAGRALDEAASFIAKCLQPRRGPPC